MEFSRPYRPLIVEPLTAVPTPERPRTLPRKVDGKRYLDREVLATVRRRQRENG